MPEKLAANAWAKKMAHSEPAKVATVAIVMAVR